MRFAAHRRPQEEDRRAAILAAAARAFVRYGFHAATMTQVAEEAGMSAGNLYRYFPSKEAIVEGLCECDQVERSENFAALVGSQDLKSAMRHMLREHVLGCAQEKARMIVEIWAESSRNPRVAEFTLRLDREVIEGLVGLVDLAKARGAAAAGVDSRFVARAMFSLVSGLFKRKALEADFDVAAESAMALGVFEALFSGAAAPGAEI